MRSSEMPKALTLGMAVEMAAEPKRVGQQLKVASKKGFPLALVTPVISMP